MTPSTPQGTRSRARRAGAVATNLAVLAAVLLCAAWLVPSLFGYSRYVITGPSMTGTYDKGSIVFEKQVPVDRLRVGDVVTYLPPADAGVPNLVTHRIVRMQPAQGGGTLLTTKGDNNPTADPWHFQLTDQVQPVVQFSVPHAGWVFVALADREVRMLVVGIPAALVGLVALGQLVGVLRGGKGATAKPVPAPAALGDVAVPPQRPVRPAVSA
jgi:signal peptidase